MTTQQDKKQRPMHRRLTGRVVSARMAKTIVVLVERQVQHPKYGKTHTVSRKFKAHDEHGKARVGDVVEISETRPISKDKNWNFVRVVTPAE